MKNKKLVSKATPKKSNPLALPWLNNVELPRTRIELNSWSRSMYILDPDVHRIISQHATNLTGAFEFVPSKNKAVNEFFREQLNTLNLPFQLFDYLVEYFVAGEVFLYAELDEAKGRWSRILMQNPDYMLVKRDVSDSKKTTHYLRPDENLRRICLSDKTEHIIQQSQLNSEIVSAIKNGQNIPLDRFYSTQLIRKVSTYEVRGCGVLIPLFSQLIQDDRSEQARNIIRLTLMDPTLDKSMGINKEALLMQYSIIGNQTFAPWLNENILQPIAKIQGFYDYSGKEKKLFVPKITFNSKKIKGLLSI